MSKPLAKVQPHYDTDHDNIEIKQFNRPIRIRQDRMPIRSGEFNIKFKDSTSWEVVDIAPFGVSIKTSTPFSGDTYSAELWSENILLSSLTLTPVRHEPYEDAFKIAFSVDSDPIHFEKLQASRDVLDIIKTHKALFENQSINPQFRLISYQVYHWLTTLEQKVNQIEKNNFDWPRAEIDSYENVVTQVVAGYIEQNIFPLYQELEKITNPMKPKDKKEHFEFFRQTVGRHMFQSYYANRAYQKPRGYAGDFEMMRTVYHHEIRGTTLFGRCIERYFTDVPEAQAVRNRGHYLMQKIVSTLQKNPKAKILSVASGPAMEIQYLMTKHPELMANAEIHLVDQDIDALKLSQRAIESLARSQNISTPIHFHNWAIKNIIESGVPIDHCDLIYTAGLFDYLSAPVAQAAASKLYQALNPQAELIIGNFDVSAPNRFGMALVTDWHLIYRTEEELKEIFSPISLVKIEKEPLGINLFACLWKA